VLRFGHDISGRACDALNATKPLVRRVVSSHQRRAEELCCLASFAMVLSPAPVVPAGQGGGEAGSADAGSLLAQAAAGPGFWEDLLGELRRQDLIAELLADGVIARAVAQAGHGHKLDRVLTAEVTTCASSSARSSRTGGYDMVLARTFAMLGLPVKPGTVTPSGPALSRARVLLGDQVMRRIFEIDACSGRCSAAGLDLGFWRRHDRHPCASRWLTGYW